jgi:hypothetical protein
LRYNSNTFSNSAFQYLYDLGVYLQPDGTVAVSDSSSCRERNVDDLDLTSCQSVSECIKHLEGNFEDTLSDFVSIWDELVDYISNMERKPVASNSIPESVFFVAIQTLLSIASDCEELGDAVSVLSELAYRYSEINSHDASMIGYYSSIISSVNDEMLTEYNRKEDIKELSKMYKIASSPKKVVTAFYLGIEEGIGPSGRNNPMSPFSNFDGAYDRVMDGREIGEGKGHVYDKFREANKFKRYPWLLGKAIFKYRKKALRFQPKMKRKRKRRKGRKNKMSMSGNGYVYVDVKRDPAYIKWPEYQINNPYSWNSRGIDSTYPTWETYKGR